MAVYYKFKSAKDFDLIHFEGKFISVYDLKRTIFASMYKNSRRILFDKLIVLNAQTNEEYVDEATIIQERTSLLIRRVPRRSGFPIIVELDKKKDVEKKVEEKQSSNMLDAYTSSHEIDFDDFGDDVFAIPVSKPAQSSNPTVAVETDEEKRIKASVQTPAHYRKSEPHDPYDNGSCWRGTDGRMMTGYYFGQGRMEKKTPPPGYVCHRCRVPGHFIHHCPTNGDPTYEIKKMELPTSVSKSMLKANPEGLPGADVAVLKPVGVVLEKEIGVSPSTRSGCDIPPELHCPLCRQVMRDAMFTSKCCFRSFCATCIRDYIISNSSCICGATNMKADDLIPNRTVRETIGRLESSTCSSTITSGSLDHQPKDVVSTHQMQLRAPHTISMVSKECASEAKSGITVTDSLKKKTAKRSLDLSEERVLMSSSTSQGGVSLPEEVHEKLLGGEQGKMKKRKDEKIKKKHQAAQSQLGVGQRLWQQKV